MKLPKYELISSHRSFNFEFTSKGPKGVIVKEIQFVRLNKERIYNLSFGDKDPETGEIDDFIVSNNGDSEKILATVVSAVYGFLQKNPDARVFVSASSASRMRLYRMAISRYIHEMMDHFDIYGNFNNNWEAFEPGKDYTDFIGCLKNLKFEL